MPFAVTPLHQSQTAGTICPIIIQIHARRHERRRKRDYERQSGRGRGEGERL